MKIIGIGVPVAVIVLLLINQYVFTLPIVGLKIKEIVGAVTAPIGGFVKRMLGKGQPAGA